MSWRRGRAYGQGLRDRVLTAKGRLREVAERFGVSQAYVSRVRSRQERLGQTSAGKFAIAAIASQGDSALEQRVGNAGLFFNGQDAGLGKHGADGSAGAVWRSGQHPSAGGCAFGHGTRRHRTSTAPAPHQHRTSTAPAPHCDAASTRVTV